MFQVEGKVALITGGAKGIGLCIAWELLRNEAKGVALIDIDNASGNKAVDELTRKYGKNCAIYINADVSQRSQFDEAFGQTIKTFKHLDIVVNNAGVVQEMQWEKSIAVNFQGCVTGSLLAMDKYFPECLSTGEGIILNVSSMTAFVPVQETPVYSGTKHGVLGFSKALSGPLRSHNLNVKVLTICPGTTITSIIRPNSEQIPQKFIASVMETGKSFGSQTPSELACHIVSIMKEGKTGSVWAVNSNIRTKIESPNVNFLTM